MCVCVCVYEDACFDIYTDTYGVAMISRLLKIIGLFCKRALQKRRYSAKETYNFAKPTNRSHPISIYARMYVNVCMYVCIYVYVCMYI